MAGDGLLNYAFETACLAFDKARSPEEYQRAARAMTVLSRKAGIYGMIGGQCADIEAEEHQEKVTEELLLLSMSIRRRRLSSVR